jgi:hypothetical protein
MGRAAAVGQPPGSPAKRPAGSGLSPLLVGLPLGAPLASLGPLASIGGATGRSRQRRFCRSCIHPAAQDGRSERLTLRALLSGRRSRQRPQKASGSELGGCSSRG